MKTYVILRSAALLLLLVANSLHSSEAPRKFGGIQPSIHTENGGMLAFIAELMIAPGLAIGPTFIEFGYCANNGQHHKNEQTSAEETLVEFGYSLILGAAYDATPGTLVIKVNVDI